jgi:hypothetical protein
MKPTILVEACEGRHCPLHPDDVPSRLAHSVLKPEDGSLEVHDSTAIRRRIRAGDLKVSKVAQPLLVDVKSPSSPK